MLLSMTTTSRATPVQALRTVLYRVRAVLPVASAPHYVEPRTDPRVDWLRRLDRVRSTLEQARADLFASGWTSGAWFTVATADGGTRAASPAESLRLTRPGASVSGACLVGTMLQRADDPDRATSHADVWACVDELVEALHERMDHPAYPPGWSHPPAQRYARLRVLTAWNDAPGRTQDEVVALLDHTIGRTIVGACRAS